MKNKKLELTTVNINELINFTSALIEFDNAGLINSAQEVTAKYKDLVVTEDVVPTINKKLDEELKK